MTAATGSEAAQIIQACRADNSFFIEQVLGAHLTPQQKSVCWSLQNYRRTAVPAGHGVGKTYLAARWALQRLYAYPEGSKVITTAPTWTQVEMLLWRELRKAYADAVYPLGGTMLKTQLDVGEDWYAIGISTNDVTRMQGFHAPVVTVILDEAVGVDPLIWEALEGVAIGPNDRWLAIGNPTDPISKFKEACTSPLWNVVRLNAEEHPNVISGEIVVPGAVTREWVQEREIDYGGRDTALYRARVLGLFPEQGDDMLISLADVERAQARWAPPHPDDRPLTVGVDIARYGSDETVEIEIYDDPAAVTAGSLTPWHTVAIPRPRRGQNLMETAGSVKANRAARKAVDDAGLGVGVTDRLRELGVDVIPYNAGEKPFDQERFLNRRAESWWMIREALKRDELALPPDNKLAADLTNVKYTYTSRGQIKLESKDDVKERLGRSPDRGDALAIALYALTAPTFDVTEEERDLFGGLQM